MAATLKLGDRKWATKEGSLLAYNDENNNYKPLPFDFTRASSATRVNKQGLIETVASGVPRIDFTDANGALKLEPQRSNLITQSEAFDNAYWTKSGSSVVSGFTSPSGELNAFKLVEDTSTGTHNTYSTVLVNAGDNSFSMYVKANGRRYISLYTNSRGSEDDQYGFDLNGAGSVTYMNPYGDAIITSLNNGWYRISITHPSSGFNTRIFRLYLSNAQVTNTTIPSYTGDGTSGIYVAFAQLEAGSYATSYIPTQGSAVTVVAEKCEQNLSNVVSLTEGVVYIDTTNLGNDGTNSNIISQNSVVDTVYCLKVGINNKIACGLFASSVNIPINSTSAYPLGTRTKIAFHYKSGNSKLYINGSLEGTNNASFTLGSGFATALRLIDASSAYNAFPQKSIVREFKVYNSGLTDAELIALTTI
jgi:hypothetical protein